MHAEYCCEPFHNALNNAGKKGFSIVLKDTAGIINYYIQTRVCDFEIDNSFREATSEHMPQEYSFPVVIQKKIGFCPFCGKKLATLINPKSEFAQTTLKQHSDYIVTPK